MNTELNIRPVIVVPAHRRAGSLQRLLNTIGGAKFPDQGVRLIISVDGAGSQDVVDAARAFVFAGGEVEVVVHAEQMGLREHILWCGDLSQEHGAVIVLEDDLVVDPFFYDYAMQALDFYGGDESVAGIALYSQRYNDHAELPFEPLKTGFSTFFMQVGCSWGQVWSAGQWAAFRQWYGLADYRDVEGCAGLPDNVKRWSESSWKKYFNAFIVDSGRFIVYPYDSFSTNCSDSPGVHIKEVNNVFQVALRSPVREPEVYRFAPSDDPMVAYDAYMEPSGRFIFDALKLDPGQVEIDIHGYKPWDMLPGKEFVLTTRVLEGVPLAVYPVSFRPIELNLLYPVMMEDTVKLCLYRMRADMKPVEVTPSAYFNMTRYYSNFDSRNLKYARGYFREFLRNLGKFYLDHRK